MFVCMCVCVCVCMHICMYVCVCMYACVCMYVSYLGNGEQYFVHAPALQVCIRVSVYECGWCIRVSPPSRPPTILAFEISGARAVVPAACAQHYSSASPQRCRRAPRTWACVCLHIDEMYTRTWACVCHVQYGANGGHANKYIHVAHVHMYVDICKCVHVEGMPTKRKRLCASFGPELISMCCTRLQDKAY